MKKTIHPTALPVLTVAAGAVGALLRLWLLSSLSEERLLKAWHPAAILSGLLAITVIAGLFLFTRPLKGQGKYRVNFPASIPAAVCCALAGLAMFLRGMGLLIGAPAKIYIIAGIACVLCAPCLVLMGMSRWKGQRTVFLLHVVPCAAFACLLMIHYQTWTASPVLHLHVCRLLALAGLMLVSYHRAEFDVRLANRRGYAFLNLVTMFFCLLAIPEGDGLFFLVMAAWLFTNQCALTIFRQRRPAPKEAEAEEAAPAEAPPQEPAAEVTPAEPGQEEV